MELPDVTVTDVTACAAKANPATAKNTMCLFIYASFFQVQSMIIISQAWVCPQAESGGRGAGEVNVV